MDTRNPLTGISQHKTTTIYYLCRAFLSLPLDPAHAGDAACIAVTIANICRREGIDSIGSSVWESCVTGSYCGGSEEQKRGVVEFIMGLALESMGANARFTENNHKYN